MRKIAGELGACPASGSCSGDEDLTGWLTTGIYTITKKINFTTLMAFIFEFESTGIETHFADLRDTDWRSRRGVAFFRHGTLLDWIKEKDTHKDRLQIMPYLANASLRDRQFEAIY